MKDLTNKVITITDKESMYYKEWGTIKFFDGDYYHVAIADGKDSMPIFSRDQFKLYNPFKKYYLYGHKSLPVYDAEISGKKYRITEQDGVCKLMKYDRTNNEYYDTNWSCATSVSRFSNMMLKTILKDKV